MPLSLTGRLRSAALAVAFAALASAASAAPFRLIVTDLEPPLVPNSIMDLAISQGYFEREGVDVELVRVQQTPSAIAAIQSGEGEMANVGVDALLQLVAQGNTDLKAVVSPNKSLPYIIAGKAELKTPADLAGHSFGIGRPGSLDHSLSQLVLKQAGVDLSSLNFVALGQPNVRAQALAAGQVDATTISIGVWLSIPDKTGLGIIVDQPTYYAAAPTVNKVNIVSAKTLSERHDEVLGVIRALIKISRDYAANPQAWADNLAPLLPNVQKATLDELAKTFTGSWSVNGGLSATELQFTQDYLYGTEDFKDAKPVTLADWVDFGPVDEVLKDLGTDQSGDTPAR